MNQFALLVGKTATARKGTAWGYVERLFEAVAACDGLHTRVSNWLHDCVYDGGLSTGEGLISHVRDPHLERGDQGIGDKRLLVVESEFAFPLQTMQRPGNTLSPVLRRAWDGRDRIGVITKNTPLQATGAHISVIGHITEEEFVGKVDRLELANGFANRFPTFLVQRSKALPLGGNVTDEELKPLAERLRAAVEFGCAVGRMRFDSEAEAVWREVYLGLTDGKAGLFGAVTARAAPHVLRFACLYALTDKSPLIRLPHLRAALALWGHAEASAAALFGTGDPVADRVLALLRVKAAEGATETTIRDHFQRHKGDEIDRALDVLERLRLARHVSEPTGGRPRTRWYATEATRATEVPDAKGSGSEGDHA
jgi:hypothetical protein